MPMATQPRRCLVRCSHYSSLSFPLALLHTLTCLFPCSAPVYPHDVSVACQQCSRAQLMPRLMLTASYTGAFTFVAPPTHLPKSASYTGFIPTIYLLPQCIPRLPAVQQGPVGALLNPSRILHSRFHVRCTTHSLVYVLVVHLVYPHNVSVAGQQRQQAPQCPRQQRPVDGKGVLHQSTDDHSTGKKEWGRGSRATEMSLRGNCEVVQREKEVFKT